MDIAALSTAMAQSKVITDVRFAVLNLAKDTMQQTSNELINMIKTSDIERSVNPHIGGNIDIKV